MDTNETKKRTAEEIISSKIEFLVCAGIVFVFIAFLLTADWITTKESSEARYNRLVAMAEERQEQIDSTYEKYVSGYTVYIDGTKVDRVAVTKETFSR